MYFVRQHLEWAFILKPDYLGRRLFEKGVYSNEVFIEKLPLLLPFLGGAFIRKNTVYIRYIFIYWNL